jgi:hypothetical protein
LGSAPEDGELRSAQPRARTWAQPRKTANSAPPDPGLGLGLSPRRRRTPLRPTQGSDLGSAPEDGELCSTQPRARTWAQPRKTANSTPPDPGLGLGLSPGRRRTPLRRTQCSDSGLAPEDGELRFARPRARTRAQPRKTANSAPPDPGLGLGLSPGRRRTLLRLTPGLGLSPGLSRRSPPRPTQGLGLDLGHGRQTRPRPRRSLHIAQPRARTGHVNRRRHHYPTPQADSGYGKQDRRPIWLAPPDKVMMAPRTLYDDGGSKPPYGSKRTSARTRQP